jgi:hypothetical protein
VRADWRDFYLVKDELRLWTDADVDAAEESLAGRLPPGYRELMTTLGDGTFCDDLRVFAPTELASQQAFFRTVFEQAWFFDDPDEELTPAYALASTSFAESLQGDQIIFHAGTGRIHVLPRDQDRTYIAGTDLPEVVTWWLDSGVMLRPRPFRFFESLLGPTGAVNGEGNRTSLPRVSEAIRSLDAHDFEVTEEDEADRTFFVRAIGGFLSVQGSGPTDVYVHFRYQTDHSPEIRAQLQEAAVDAGVTFSEPWSMAP